MKQCLNCETELRGSYCHQCGQKSSTHRYSLNTLFTHDLLHSIWHLDKSILRSWWYVLKTPGKEGHKNIAGKRAGQFPILTLAIFATVLLLWAVHFRVPEGRMTVKFGSFDLSEWVRHNAKWLWMSLILFFALSDLICFRRLRYNLAEHIVLTTYNYTGLVSVVAIILFLVRLGPGNWLWLDWVLPVVFMIYLIYASWQSFKSPYGLVGWLWRFVLSLLSFLGFILLVIFFISLVLSTKLGDSTIQLQYETSASPKSMQQQAPH